MPALQLILILVCVVSICIGQLLFKRVGIELELVGTWMNLKVLMFAFTSFAIYGAATLLWIHLLRILPLNQAYPFMALSFVIVPLLSFLLFGEKLALNYFIGMTLIVGGIVIITRNCC